MRSDRPLFPGPCELEILLAKDRSVLARHAFHVGTEEEAAKARARLLDWLRGARQALRDLSVQLERRGLYHVAQLGSLRARGARDASTAKAQVDGFEEFLQAVWNERFRSARMDFSAYERELVLPPFPGAARAFLDLFAALRTRRDGFRKALDDLSRGVPAALGERGHGVHVHALSASLLEGDPDLALWDPGPTAEPERGAISGETYESPAGFSLVPPQGWRAEPSTVSPEERVRFLSERRGEGELLVRVFDGVEAASDEDFERYAEVMLSWESFSSYRRLEGGRLVDGRPGCWRVFTAREEGTRRGPGRKIKRLEVDLFGKRRVVSLTGLAPEDGFDALRETFERCAATLKIEEQR
jgi:hypothetical protein